MALFSFNSQDKSFSQFPGLAGDELLVHVFNVLGNVSIPFLKHLKMCFDRFNVVVVSLELLELERLIEIVNIFTLLEFINNDLEIFEILNDLCLDSSLGGLVSI